MNRLNKAYLLSTYIRLRYYLSSKGYSPSDIVFHLNINIESSSKSRSALSLIPEWSLNNEHKMLLHIWRNISFLNEVAVLPSNDLLLNSFLGKISSQCPGIPEHIQVTIARCMFKNKM